MDEHSFFKEAFNWLLGAVLAVALYLGRQANSRSVRRQDSQEKDQKELEARVRELERNAVTRDDVRRIELKIDDQFGALNSRLDRIIERDA